MARLCAQPPGAQRQFDRKCARLGTVGLGRPLGSGERKPHPQEQELCIGQHTVSIAGRSNGVAIDALRIFVKDTTPPEQ